MDNSTENTFLNENPNVVGCKNDLKKYFHTPDYSLNQKFLIIYKIFNLSDSKVAEKIGIDKSSMNRYRRGVWIPSTDLKIKIAQILTEFAGRLIDSSIIWGDSVYFEKWRNENAE